MESNRGIGRSQVYNPGYNLAPFLDAYAKGWYDRQLYALDPGEQVASEAL